MANPWMIHGLSMDDPWIIHGLSMDHPWIIHEFIQTTFGENCISMFSWISHWGLVESFGIRFFGQQTMTATMIDSKHVPGMECILWQLMFCVSFPADRLPINFVEMVQFR